MKKSNLDVAYEILDERLDSLSFQELWQEVVRRQGHSEEEAKNLISKFYTNLFMDGRFIALKDNEWALRDRHTFEEAHIDMSDVYSDDEKIDGLEDEDDIEEDFEEEKSDDDSEEDNSLNEDEDL